jgi:hypothetical protein
MHHLDHHSDLSIYPLDLTPTTKVLLKSSSTSSSLNSSSSSSTKRRKKKKKSQRNKQKKQKKKVPKVFTFDQKDDDGGEEDSDSSDSSDSSTSSDSSDTEKDTKERNNRKDHNNISLSTSLKHQTIHTLCVRLKQFLVHERHVVMTYVNRLHEREHAHSIHIAELVHEENGVVHLSKKLINSKTISSILKKEKDTIENDLNRSIKEKESDMELIHTMTTELHHLKDKHMHLEHDGTNKNVHIFILYIYSISYF